MAARLVVIRAGAGCGIQGDPDSRPRGSRLSAPSPSSSPEDVPALSRAFTLEVAAVPASPATVRQALAEWACFVEDDERADLLIAANELVCNSVRHGPAGGRVRIRAVRGAGTVEVEVEDDGDPSAVRRRPPDATSGRGLHLVDAVSAAWGVRPGPGCTVWFVLAAPGA
ncbi:MAG: regulatory protein [Solirubrobacterales bacterium]|nr:regulatory protein [Solirubrobacterales bacterium]